MRAPSGCSSSSGSPAAAGAAAAGASAGEGAAAGAALPPRRRGGRSSTPSSDPLEVIIGFHTPLARPAAATCLGQLHLGPAPTAALWKLLLRVVPPPGPAPPRRQRASFPLQPLGASDARPDPVTVAVKAVTGRRVNDMVTTRSKAKHEAPQGAAAPQGPSTPQAPVRPPGERRRSARLRDQVLDTPGVHKSKNKPRRARWSSYTDSDGDHHSSEEY